MTKSDSTTIQRSYKFCCYPNSIQRQQLAVEFGHARWVWNKCLAWRNHAYKEYGEKVSGVDFSRELTFLFLSSLGLTTGLKRQAGMS